MTGPRNNIVSVRFTDEQLAALRRYADRHGDDTLGAAIRRAVGYAELLTDPGATVQVGDTTLTWRRGQVLPYPLTTAPVTSRLLEDGAA